MNRSKGILFNTLVHHKSYDVLLLKGFKVAQDIIDKINSFQTFRFDSKTNRIVNMRFQEETDIDEFLSIQHILDSYHIPYRFDKNFDIEVISR